MTNTLTNILGTSWRTSVLGFITLVAAFITQYPDLLDGLFAPDLTKKIFSVAALISGIATFSQAKDKNVTGGTIQAKTNVTIPTVPPTEVPSVEQPAKTEAKV